MTIIKGHYRIAGASPDGDSVRFYPDDPTVWEHAGIAVKANSTGGVQLRLDAIDALETHYTPPHAPTQWRQPTELGDGASAALLDLLGFTDVARDDRGYVTSATPDQTRGHILTRFADAYGRAVAMVYPGGRRGRATDGSSIYLDVPELRRSVNWQLLDAGWVYPTFYSKLYVDLREDLAATAAPPETPAKGCGPTTRRCRASRCGLEPNCPTSWSSCPSCFAGWPSTCPSTRPARSASPGSPPSWPLTTTDCSQCRLDRPPLSTPSSSVADRPCT